MTTVSQTFLDRWRAADSQVGVAAPIMRVEVRKGRYFRGFETWTYPEPISTPDYALIPNSPNQWGNPTCWQATWTPQGDWMTLPGVAQVTTSKDVSDASGNGNNGIGTCQVTVENTRLQFFEGINGGYHVWDRGYLTPFRSDNALPIFSDQLGFTKEWFGVLIRNAQIRVWQGYGADTMVPVFVGLIDDADYDSGSNGDKVVLTCRSHGRILSDSRLFGWNKDPTLSDPIVFADRGWCENNPDQTGDWWMQVDDVSNIVRLILRWAGFKHWRVQDTQQGLNPGQPLSFDRSHFYSDVIQTCCQLTGFCFFVGDPDPNDDESIGIPIFRYPRNLIDLDETMIVHDRHLLTDVETKVSDQERAYIIRVRGKIPELNTPQGYNPTIVNPTQIDAQMAKWENIVTLGGDTTLRPTAVYRPPWTVLNQEAGVLKHVTHTDDYLVTYAECLTACFLIAAQEAIDSYTAKATCPGNPAIGLDEHVSIYDHGTGISSRVWVNHVESSFSQGIDQESEEQLLWTTTFSGALLDTPDMEMIKQELAQSNINNTPFLPIDILPVPPPVSGSGGGSGGLGGGGGAGGGGSGGGGGTGGGTGGGGSSGGPLTPMVVPSNFIVPVDYTNPVKDWDFSGGLPADWFASDGTNQGNHNTFYLASQVSHDGTSTQLTAAPYGQSGYGYKSGYISTQNRYSFSYGRYRVQAMMPPGGGGNGGVGQGLWPGIWGVRNDGGFEIDVLEMLLADATSVYGTLHNWQNGWASSSIVGRVTNDSTVFNTFEMIWQPGMITVGINNVGFAQFTKAQAGTANWNFDVGFFYPILNLSISGGGQNWDSIQPSSATISEMPTSMRVSGAQLYQ